MREVSDSQIAGYIAASAAAFMIATQVASKATRDALFLSNFNTDQLPLMWMAAAAFSLVMVLWASRAMARLSPARLIPPVFFSSAFLLLIEWSLIDRFERVASVLLYLHVAAFGSFLVSGFWSIVNERFDPRTAKKKISMIAGGGTLGGLLGGLLAERVAALASVSAMLPLMTLMHLTCGVLVYRLRLRADAARSRSHGSERISPFAGIDAIKRNPYLRDIACFLLATTAGATLIDYVFKSRAVDAFDPGTPLLRYFAVFYAAIGLVTFLIQTLLGRIVLEKLGLAATIVLLPSAAAIGGIAMVLVPGIVLASVMRGSESAIRSSLFRSGYELLYTPVPVNQKRAAKSIIDVGFDRVGDTVGALFVLIFVWLIPNDLVAHNALLGLAFLFSGIAVIIASRLHRGYVDALKNRLVDRAEELDISDLQADAANSIVLQTLGNVNISQIMGRSASRVKVREPDRRAGSRPAEVSSRDAVVSAMIDLRSGSVRKIRERLKEALDPTLTGQVVALLAWDKVSEDVIESLRRSSGRIVGELTDKLRDPLSDFATRRRIPRVLAVCDSQRAVDGLIDGFKDHRFEVRYQCAAALAKIRERRSSIHIAEDRVRQAVLSELDVDNSGWRKRQLVDANDSVSMHQLVADRMNLSLEHVFRLLSLIFEREPMQIALQGLYTNDPQLRGTAMEYLESVLPPKILSGLWPVLENPPSRPKSAARKADPRAELLMSQNSIQINLKTLRQKS